MEPFTKLKPWLDLKNHAQSLQVSRQLHPLQAPFLDLDYSNQRINEYTMDLLLSLANVRNLKQKIHALMNGDIVNQSENRPALHTALRVQSKKPLYLGTENIIPLILSARQKIKVISDTIRAGEWLGFSNKPISDIVHIGIGGSDLGPKFCVHALSALSAKHLNYHFISDAEPESFSTVCALLNPETTLFIIASKSFLTKETLYNTQKAMTWFGNHTKTNHFIAITAYDTRAHQQGIRHVLPIWSWVGGRYSACSAINLITAIAIGYESFSDLLLGAHAMDVHFREARLHENMPVVLGLLGIWNINFLNIHHLLIFTYSHYLKNFVSFVQQLDMESNGKSLDNQGKWVNFSTGPIVFGGSGNQAQHSYFQLLCQGTHKLAIDFVTLKSNEKELIQGLQHKKQKVLTCGVSDSENPQGYIAGKVPSNHLTLEHCTPEALGALISLYEHKIYVQGIIWDINSFDQPGVNSAKYEELESV